MSLTRFFLSFEKVSRIETLSSLTWRAGFAAISLVVWIAVVEIS